LAGEAVRNLLEKDIKPRDIMTRKAFENAITLVMVGPYSLFSLFFDIFRIENRPFLSIFLEFLCKFLVIQGILLKISIKWSIADELPI